MFMSATEETFSLGECSIQRGGSNLNGTCHLSPNENIRSVELKNIHYHRAVEFLMNDM